MKVKIKVIIFCFLMILAARLAYAKDIHVPSDYPTIQEAIDAAVPDDRVIVAEGTYEENIILKSNVDVLGAGAEVTTITASSGYVITADNIGSEVVISGFTIDGQWTSSRGISCVRNSSPTISDNVITHSMEGIICTDSSPVIINNTITYLVEYGFRCEASRPIIRENVISHVGADAISFGNASLAIINNKIVDAGRAGISCWGEGGAFIEDNEITKSTYGIECRDISHPIIRGNVIKENFRYGIIISSFSRPDIGTEVEPGMNAIYDNGEYDVNNQTDNIIMAEMNWWGKTLPDPEQFWGDVDYKPWLTKPPYPISGSINGHVTDVAGESLRAFVIAINSETKEKDKTVTDVDGSYEIPNLEPGIYWVLCIKKGYKLGIKKVEVKAGETTTVDFQLIPK